MDELDAALADLPVTPPTLAGAQGKPAKCRRHDWRQVIRTPEHIDLVSNHDCLTMQCDGYTEGVRIWTCRQGDALKDEARSRRGKQSRNYGNRAELSAARKYGGEKIGHAGGPVDVRGTDFNTQVKTHRRLPPLEWRKAFSAMEGKGERYPRLLLRFVQGPGLPPVDYMVVPGDVWLDWFGKDGDE